MKLCTCNNCGNIYQDTNPTDNAKDYTNDLPVNTLVKLFEDKNIETGYLQNRCIPK